jgi:ribonuclease HI
MIVKIYTDGACSGNPGKGGYGTILRATDDNGKIHEKELTAGYKNTTNNRMELLAVIVGLEALKKPCEVEITSDSKYVVDAFNQNWVEGWVKKGWKGSNKQPVKNRDLWERLLKAKEPHKVKFLWIKGHAGHEFNERCDKMAVASSNGENLLEDKGFSD